MFHTIHVFSFCLWLVGVFGDEVKSVMEGGNVTLHTNVTHIQTHDKIEWRFENIRIARIKRSDNINPTYNKTEIFRDRLKMNNQTGDLTITHITSQHSGLYQLKINITNKSIIRKNITVTVNAKDPKQTNGQPDYIIPFSCAAVGFLVVIALLIIYKKQRNKQQQDQTREDQITYADPTFYQHDTKTKSAQEEDTVVYSGVVTKR